LSFFRAAADLRSRHATLCKAARLPTPGIRDQVRSKHRETVSVRCIRTDTATSALRSNSCPEYARWDRPSRWLNRPCYCFSGDHSHGEQRFSNECDEVSAEYRWGQSAVGQSLVDLRQH